MKIGILTASRTNNNGTDLQALAMQMLFSSLSNSNAEIINYICPKLENSRKAFYPRGVKGVVKMPFRVVNHIQHERFRKKYFRYSAELYTKDNLQNNPYDLVVVGSDQIWNLKITGEDMSFFLPFSMRGLKSSYAASVATGDMTCAEEKYHIRQHLSDFFQVSVREKMAVDTLAGIDVKARHDLDPLLMVPVDYWEPIVARRKKKEKVVFVYTVSRTREALAYAKAYAKQNNAKVISWGPMFKPVAGVHSIPFGSIEDWLFYMKHADLVVTNSYHGLAFCVNFQKKFALFALENKDSNTRLENLLEIAGIEAQEDGTIYCPDWTRVQKKMESKRVESKQYIKLMLERATEYAAKNESLFEKSAGSVFPEDKVL